jgi:hypothetical protein
VAKLLKLKKRMPQFILMGKYARWILCVCFFVPSGTCHLLGCDSVFFFFSFFKRKITKNFLDPLTVKMKALWSSEMLGTVCATTQYNTLEDFNLLGCYAVLLHLSDHDQPRCYRHTPTVKPEAVMQL